MRRIAIILLMAGGIMSAQTLSAQTLPAQTLPTQALPTQTWDALVDSYFDEAVFPFSPTSAVQDGFHAYDAQLEDFSQATIQKEIAESRRFEPLFTAFPAAKLNADQQADR